MIVLYSILVVVATTMVLSLLLLSSIDDKLVYAQQQEQNQTDVIDMSQEEIEMNLSLGKPLYTEIFTVPKSSTNNDKSLTNSVYSFSGNGTINGIKVSASGSGLMIPREDGTRSINDGRALFTSENGGGNASYFFGAIIDTKDNVTKHLGAAFFDANATGNLEFLNSVVGIYKALIGDEKGTFVMWKLK